MPDRDGRFRRGDLHVSTQRDIDRFRRREQGEHFFRSLALIGSVGWPIVLFAIGGALLGRFLDGRFDTGIRITLILLTLGTALGSAIAFKSARGDAP